ncbi:hypothetical protein [Nostoc sp. 'Peltigera membranacea cyanobiont' N6]|uniref:hypothetical protein n=1 Tax=Nostoc sp. 'Peltigera membranacea cyanobiont' N6 TaxID=1261031 RepID=UPI000D0C0DEB|nr:hypothetical protein [Nostoc sp. 'Peltigera membranacea cyanobiont' N6]AVH68646.1 hypothetical protein NPM_90005 [Nostoc sp. 'Peltigera membranacea cyanobiont' N6]
MAKKDDPNYKKLCGLIPKTLFNDFKKWCVDNDKDLSEGLEIAVTEIIKPKSGC